MTSRPPTRRLVDVLKQNSKATLDRHAAQLAAATASLPAEAIQTRFLRNQFLINPKSLHLLSTEEQLASWHVFGVYKPPFCPMRRADAADNYHRVSVESFIESALQSRTIFPVLNRILTPSELRVRVLYNLDTFASGPVMVSVSDQHKYATSLRTTTMEYDLMVAGHLPLHSTESHNAIDIALLFPHLSANREVDVEGVDGASSAAHYEVKANGYYSVHPVSLLNVVIRGPPTSRPPTLERFAREQLGTCVLGDPLVMGELMHMRAMIRPPHEGRDGRAVTMDRTEDFNGSSGSAAHVVADSGVSKSGRRRRAGLRDSAAQAAAMKLAANPHIISTRGDCDFPRVFLHLREVRIDTASEISHQQRFSDDPQESQGTPPSPAMAAALPPHPTNSGSSAAAPTENSCGDTQEIRMHCRKCFTNLIQNTLSGSLKSRRMSLLDGSWTPQSEQL